MSIRSGCFCENLSKPCTYHEGYADGFDEGLLAGGRLMAKVERDQSDFEEFGL